MPFYKVDQQKNVTQIKPSAFKSEKELQTLFEKNLETLLGVRFIATEFTTGDRQRGRIDSLGLDEDNSPVIIEYKKSSKDNVINQGLFYLDWLVDHKDDFTIAAQELLGKDIEISWSSPRVILIAESFSEYDKYAVNRIGANIELWTYRRYGDDYLFLETIFAATGQKAKCTSTKEPVSSIADNLAENEQEEILYTLEDHLEGKAASMQKLFDALREEILNLNVDGDILEKPNKMYVSYKHGKNFCEIRIQAKRLKIWLDIAQEDINDPKNLTRDVSNIGHYGTGKLETNLSSLDELNDILFLIEQSYRQTL